jgi:hypothetical protein
LTRDSPVTQKTRPPEARYAHLPVGPRLEAVLLLAYRARRAVLLEGPTGIGKSEIVRKVARRLGAGFIVLDLSLLEPPDLVGLPVITGGRTTYALPSILPTEGEGILMLEELNRAERYIQQPALQLLSARRLHDYELPPGWVCFAAINPEASDYHVTAIDRALRARFMCLPVRADRASWLAWAQRSDVHPGILALAQAHERILDEVPPRTWTYASQVLAALTPEETADTTLLRDALSGYLPPSWVELLIAGRAGWSTKLPFDVGALLGSYAPGSPLARELASFRERGLTDRFDEIAARLVPLLEGPEAGVLIAEQQLTAASLEALLADLPGDYRERLSEAIAKNPTATPLAGVRPEELLQNYAQSAAQKRIVAWRASPSQGYRLGLAVTALRAHLENQAKLVEVKRSNVVRTSLGLLLADLPERWAMPLVDTLLKLGITPVRPR